MKRGPNSKQRHTVVQSRPTTRRLNKTDIKEVIRLLTDEAQKQGADANDSTGIIRALVTAHGFGFEAWFCVCCEIADRNAQKEGFKNQFERAASRMKVA